MIAEKGRPSRGVTSPLHFIGYYAKLAERALNEKLSRADIKKAILAAGLLAGVKRGPGRQPRADDQPSNPELEVRASW
ncbi:MAG: hypothetical protein ABSE44_03275 [Candidatus Sulfotelmatobacter sp.]